MHPCPFCGQPCDCVDANNCEHECDVAEDPPANGQPLTPLLHMQGK